ncbi:MAG: sodium:solute symporter [Bacteroidetes bacterium]|nr:sodium:solute symporter [Bacteroidota bacterium]
MQPITLLLFISVYTLMLFGITWITSRGANNESYFVGNRSSNWFLVAYGMIGASLSGVTFMSVPGDTGNSHFWYLQIVFGYFVGYFIIAYVLLPIYYRMKLTSIYSYLGERLGKEAHRTGAFFFLLSRTLGAACRMYIVVLVLQKFVFENWNIPFAVTTAIFILLILAYTFKGGVKTIVWTDSLQTTFMLLSLVLSVILIASKMNIDIPKIFSHISKSVNASVFNLDWKSGYFFPKAFLGGIFIAVTMTGMDQEMMQKNISCRSLHDAKKNMITFSFVMVLVNIIFLSLGVLLWEYAGTMDWNSTTHVADAVKNGMLRSDELYPHIAIHALGTVSGLFFIIGLISAAYPSADGALTALTASFCMDFLGFSEKKSSRTEEEKMNTRKKVHLAFAVLLFISILILKAVSERAIIEVILFIASVTYGPLLGLFSFGILTKRKVKGMGVIIVPVLSAALCFVAGLATKLDKANHLLGGYKFGNELLIINGALVFFGLFLISEKNNQHT